MEEVVERASAQAFGDDFVLPPDRAYSETCAGVASVMLAWRRDHVQLLNDHARRLVTEEGFKALKLEPFIDLRPFDQLPAQVGHGNANRRTGEN